MFQEIHPHTLRNEYTPSAITPQDYLIIYKNNTFLLRDDDGKLSFPTYGEATNIFTLDESRLTYLFSLDGTAFFLTMQEIGDVPGYTYQGIFAMHAFEPEWQAFAGATAMHLASWYEARSFCGKCGKPAVQHEKERALVCNDCNITEYPKISPVVIVAVTDNNRILLTKYANAGYKRYALIAGFMEIGESFEETIRREVFEEVGLHVKNFRYFKSQPWAFSQSVLAGFYVDVDGDTTPHVDNVELSEAVWFEREDIPTEGNVMSLTWTMVEAFRAGENK